MIQFSVVVDLTFFYIHLQMPRTGDDNEQQLQRQQHRNVSECVANTGRAHIRAVYYSTNFLCSQYAFCIYVCLVYFVFVKK